MIEVGQVLSLRIRFSNEGVVSASSHPYLVVAIHDELGVIEIGQIDSLAGKWYKAAMKSNKTIFCDDPIEKVIDRDSYIQLDNRFTVQNFEELENYRRQPDKLSSNKLQEVIEAYITYHTKYDIDENKIVYMDKDEILRLNR